MTPTEAHNALETLMRRRRATPRARRPPTSDRRPLHTGWPMIQRLFSIVIFFAWVAVFCYLVSLGG